MRTITIVLLSIALATPALAQKKSRFRSGSEVRSGQSHATRARALPTKTKKQVKATTVAPSRKENNFVQEDGRTVVYKKHNVVDFDDALIEGEVKNPSEFYFVHRPEEKFGSLVKKRKNFHKEMLRDTVMIR